MGKILGAVLGAKPPKPQGPSASALAAQKAQTENIAKREAAEQKKAAATRAVIGARSGRGQGVTLNPVTGERGVISAGKLGGS